MNIIVCKWICWQRGTLTTRRSKILQLKQPEWRESATANENATIFVYLQRGCSGCYPRWIFRVGLGKIWDSWSVLACTDIRNAHAKLTLCDYAAWSLRAKPFLPDYQAGRESRIANDASRTFSCSARRLVFEAREWWVGNMWVREYVKTLDSRTAFSYVFATVFGRIVRGRECARVVGERGSGWMELAMASC